MRRFGVVLTVVAVVGVPLTTAVAKAPSPTPEVPSAAASGSGQPVCTVDDSRMIELSGLVATDTGYVAVNDSQPNAKDMRIFQFDSACRYKSLVSYPSDARDPEDLALDANGVLWVADIGDNPTANERRKTIALWKLAPGANQKPVIHRMSYPDGPHDAEALIINGDGTPVIVTKEVNKAAGVYVPSAPLVPNTTAGVPLKRVGEVKLPETKTSNPLGAIGRAAVTGAGRSPDGKRVALRTYADAFEWVVPDGDVVKAITTGTPRITPLPDEPFGESIAYSHDGKSWLTISDLTGPSKLLRYVAAVSPEAANASSGAVNPHKVLGFFDKLTLQDITYLIGAVGLLGLLLVVIGVVGIRRSRRARQRAGNASTRAAGPVRGAASVPRRPDDEDLPPMRSRGAVYGAPAGDYGQERGGRPEAGYDGGYADGGYGAPRFDLPDGGRSGGNPPSGRYPGEPRDGGHRTNYNQPDWDGPGDYDDRDRGYSRR
jgi:hypothetical protein